MAYVRLVALSINTLVGIVIYVPALHSNTSSLKACFSLVQSMQKESSHDYSAIVTVQNAASGIVTLKGKCNKSYCLSDVAEQ